MNFLIFYAIIKSDSRKRKTRSHCQIFYDGDGYFSQDI